MSIIRSTNCTVRNVRGMTVVILPDNDDSNCGVEMPVMRPEDRETVVRVTSEDSTAAEIQHQIRCTVYHP